MYNTFRFSDMNYRRFTRTKTARAIAVPLDRLRLEAVPVFSVLRSQDPINDVQNCITFPVQIFYGRAERAWSFQTVALKIAKDEERSCPRNVAKIDFGWRLCSATPKAAAFAIGLEKEEEIGDELWFIRNKNPLSSKTS